MKVCCAPLFMCDVAVTLMCLCLSVCVCTNLRSQDWRRLETSGFLEDNRLVLAFWMFFRFLKLDHGKALVEGTVGQSTSSMAAILLQPSLEEVLREPQSVRLACECCTGACMQLNPYRA